MIIIIIIIMNCEIYDVVVVNMFPAKTIGPSTKRTRR